ncbi:MAG: methyltransferase, partial [Agathobaculum sp.]|uniref:methyltransferase n=1 Tax=Agathobaculum sp. TaxID=2048138 RepID=UPI003D8B9989
SLHACDIATDLALAAAVRAQAKYIACVPCCHKELLEQYHLPELEPLTKFGVFKARFNDVLTDSMRALKLEAEGYKVSVVEYISPLDTPKNLLIRAVRTGKENARARQEYDAVHAALGTTSELDRRCAEIKTGVFAEDSRSVQ